METFEKQIQLLGELKRYDEQKYTSLKEKVLIQEAKKKGYDKNCFKSIICDSKQNVEDVHEWYYDKREDRLYSDPEMRGGKIVYEKGKWAEIIKTMTKKEAEEKLNCKIV
ncbi:hypothetical protein [Flagellimonas sp. SN16]|uniref:hypothetical protein n=1 Tax=Flagellimonas sp. SN16 TaxID=3415142 RepID=UPI003C5CBEC6